MIRYITVFNPLRTKCLLYLFDRLMLYPFKERYTIRSYNSFFLIVQAQDEFKYKHTNEAKYPKEYLIQCGSED